MAKCKLFSCFGKKKQEPPLSLEALPLTPPLPQKEKPSPFVILPPAKQNGEIYGMCQSMSWRQAGLTENITSFHVD